MGRARAERDLFLAAAGFLTRLPLAEPPGWQPDRLARASRYFPAVGALVGLAGGLVWWLAGLALPPAAAAGLALAAMLWLTGALHEDGLADAADGLIGGQDREARLAIMRDSRLGTFGVLALVLSVALRAAALAAIGDTVFAALALVAAHAASRAALPTAMRILVPARADGLGAGAGKPSLAAAVFAAAIGVAVALSALGPARGLVAVALAAAAVAATGMLAQRRIGGYTGDVLGALQQIGEIVMLLAAAAR